jgi:hypothetical protein
LCATPTLPRSWRLSRTGTHHGAHAVELAGALVEVDARLPDNLPDHVAVRYVGGRGFADVSTIQ